MGHSAMDPAFHELRPWNEGRVIGAKRPLKPQQVWAILFWLDQHRRLRDRALFDFAIDSKLRGCDVVKVRIGDIVVGGRIRDRAVVVQQKTKRPVQFELVEPARKTLLAWLERRGGTLNDYVFPSRNDYMAHMSTRQYARLVREWVTLLGIMHQIADAPIDTAALKDARMMVLAAHSSEQKTNAWWLARLSLILCDPRLEPALAAAGNITTVTSQEVQAFVQHTILPRHSIVVEILPAGAQDVGERR